MNKLTAKLTIEYFSGEAVEYTAAAPEWAKWEMKTGKTVQVAYDYQGGKTIPLSEDWREVITEFEGLE